MNELLKQDMAYVSQVYSPDPIVFSRGKGMYLYDKHGKPYLDFSAQFSACSLGHSHEELIDAIHTQLKKLTSVTSMFVTQERVTLAKQLAELAPQGLNKTLFGCTGSDANEFALKAAKHYAGGGMVLSFWRGFHGSTAGSAAATGKAETIQVDQSIGQLLPAGFAHTSPAYCYRCDFQKTFPSCAYACLHYLEKLIRHSPKVAAIITEPIFAAGGVIVPPEGYLKELRQLCDKYGILLILDEVVTGFGQAGTMFALEQFDVVPDILVTGKALTGGYIPGSAVIMREDIGKKIDALTLHGHTHSNYPLMCVSASKNLEIIQRDRLVENARLVGDYLGEQLNILKCEFEQIGDIRGCGLLWGIELVNNAKEKLADYTLGQKLYNAMLHGGLITELESRESLENCVIVLHPPLITSKHDVDEAVAIMRKSLKQCLAG